MTPKTSPTEEGVLAIERTRGDERLAQIRAEGFKAGAEAMREAAVRLAEQHRATALGSKPSASAAELAALFMLAAEINDLPIPGPR